MATAGPDPWTSIAGQTVGTRGDPGSAAGGGAPALRAWLAWLVIAGAVAFILWQHARGGPATGRAEQVALLRFQARYLVGAARFLPGPPPAALYEQARATLYGGDSGQRLRFVVLAGELVGPAEAVKELRQFRNDRVGGHLTADPKEVEVEGLLRRLYSGYARDESRGPVLTEVEQQVLRERLGWFGELALAPAGGPDAPARAGALAPAQFTLFAYLAILAAALCGAVVGGGLLLVLGGMWLMGQLGGGLTVHSRAYAQTGGAVYAETFALYMVLYLGLGYAFRWVPAGDQALLLNVLAMFLSLTVLAWPVVCGVPWSQVRDDIGWRGERRPGLGLVFGVGTYLGALPLAAVGLAVTLTLIHLQRHYGWGPDPLGPGEGPSHPIVGVALRANGWVWLQLVLVASVAAPVVEETMFRGVLYRHLREATGRFAPALSALVSALVSSFVFAVIHPQGWLGVPLLMALALAFALAREWRGSLVPPMIAHGLNNGVAALLLFVVSR